MKRIVVSVALALGLGLQSHALEVLSGSKTVTNMLAAKGTKSKVLM